MFYGPNHELLSLPCSSWRLFRYIEVATQLPVRLVNFLASLLHTGSSYGTDIAVLLWHVLSNGFHQYYWVE
eukprot:5502288-Ditylum_brightwellii.AAC.1